VAQIFRGAPIRRHAAALLIAAFIPATFFVWLTTDQFHAASVLKWHPGWAQDSTELERLLPARAKDFGSSTSFGLLFAENMERRHRSVFPILAANFGLWCRWHWGLLDVRLAYLEGQVALGRQAASGYCL